MAFLGSEKHFDVSITGTQQSPIKIMTADAINAVFGADALRFHYTKPLAGHYKGDNFEFEPPSGDEGPWSISTGKSWLIRKIHIHGPAEHLIDGNPPYQYECHLVHSRPGDEHADGPKLVVAVFFQIKEGAPSRESLRNLNTTQKTRKDAGQTLGQGPIAHPIDPRDFLPVEGHRDHWFHYEGSLTSGNFSEDVTWYVMLPEIEIPPDDFSEIGQNANQHPRATYPLNRRYVLKNYG